MIPIGTNAGNRANQVAEWMAENGGTISQCAKALGLPYDTVKQCWKRVRKKLGAQAQG